MIPYFSVRNKFIHKNQLMFQDNTFNNKSAFYSVKV